MVLLRGFSRVIGMLLMFALALICLGVAMYCLDALINLGSIRPDRLLHLASVSHHVGHFLSQIAAPGRTADLALAGGVAAVLIGLVLLAGILTPSRERLVVMDGDRDGSLSARPRTLRAMAQALAEQAPGATSIRRAKLKLSRRGTRSRLTVTAALSPIHDRREVQTALARQLEPLSGPFGLDRTNPGP